MILVIKQIGLPLRGRPILLNHSYDYRPNWTPLSPVTIANGNNYNHNNHNYNKIVKSDWLSTALISAFILLHEKFLQFDWLRAVVL